MPSSIITDLRKAQEICKVLQREHVFKGLMNRIKNIYDKCENSVVTDGKKNLELSKHLDR
jgi:hypothetical protein